jgi:hypothetical protein
MSECPGCSWENSLLDNLIWSLMSQDINTLVTYNSSSCIQAELGKTQENYLNFTSLIKTGFTITLLITNSREFYSNKLTLRIIKMRSALSKLSNPIPS